MGAAAPVGVLPSLAILLYVASVEVALHLAQVHADAVGTTTVTVAHFVGLRAADPLATVVVCAMELIAVLADAAVTVGAVDAEPHRAAAVL